ncbi:MAG: peptide-methionine (R)-S-oxide reductase MsrB [Flavobacteriaceae bacterium]|nr:peptide-methionine (R)-S-oxide reductase MsrB [Flavobacteriaceae bacterium]
MIKNFRRKLFRSSFLALSIMLASCNAKAQKAKTAPKEFAVQKTEAEWKKILSPLAYHVLRKEGTEGAFTGKYYKHYKNGTYHCGACDAALYQSQHKYDSGSGWPSFDQAISNAIHYDVDYKIGHRRVELECARCGSHLGHVFEDGPQETTGKRHCINSAALNFKSSDKSQ